MTVRTAAFFLDYHLFTIIPIFFQITVLALHVSFPFTCSSASICVNISRHKYRSNEQVKAAAAQGKWVPVAYGYVTEEAADPWTPVYKMKKIKTLNFELFHY